MNHNYIAAITTSIVALTVTMPAVATPVALTQLFPALAGVELQPAQKTSLEQLSQQDLPQIKSVLSPDQVRQFDAALDRGQSVRMALSSFDLPKPQRLKLARKLQSMRSQLTQILTPEQQQQVAKNAALLQQQQPNTAN
jgi:ADP-heptose:LPS heptosyltransferase